MKGILRIRAKLVPPSDPVNIRVYLLQAREAGGGTAHISLAGRYCTNPSKRGCFFYPPLLPPKGKGGGIKKYRIYRLKKYKKNFLG